MRSKCASCTHRHKRYNDEPYKNCGPAVDYMMLDPITFDDAFGPEDFDRAMDE